MLMMLKHDPLLVSFLSQPDKTPDAQPSIETRYVVAMKNPNAAENSDVMLDPSAVSTDAPILVPVQVGPSCVSGEAVRFMISVYV